MAKQNNSGEKDSPDSTPSDDKVLAQNGLPKEPEKAGEQGKEVKNLSDAERLAVAEQKIEDLKSALERSIGISSTPQELSNKEKEIAALLHRMERGQGKNHYKITKPRKVRRMVNGELKQVEISEVSIDRWHDGTAADVIFDLQRQVKWTSSEPFPYVATPVD